MATNPNSPLEPPTSGSTTRTSIYGNAMLSSSSVSLELANGEVIELEKFAAKKIWIDDKIEFLSQLSPIDAFEPRPPAPAAVSKAELAGWWREHETIETEVHEFDYGDMTKMKALAMEASKHNLSREETDLIEVTLNNLFAVDKLLHLLRSRRKRLNLVDLRLQWETQLAHCWSSHKIIQGNISTFATQARWSLPIPANPPLPPSLPHEPTPAQSPPALPITPADALPALTVAVTFNLAQLTKNLVPLTSATLDQLMEISRLPDAFLDEQDRMEDTTKHLANSVPRFLAEMLGQRKAADKVYRRALESVELPAEALRVELEAAVMEVTEAGKATAFAGRVAELEIALAKAAARLRQGGTGVVVLQMPTHSLVPDQAHYNSNLLSHLTKAVARAATALDGAKAQVARYEEACRIKVAADGLLGEVERCSAQLKKLVARLVGVQGQPDLSDEKCLAITEEERAYEAEVGRIQGPAAECLGAVPALIRRVPDVVVALDRAGVSVSVKRTLKQAGQQLEVDSSSVATLLAEHQRRRQQLVSVRAASADLGALYSRLDDVESAIGRQLEAARWRGGLRDHSATVDMDTDVSSLESSLDAVEVGSLAAADYEFEGQGLELLAAVKAEAVGLRARLMRLQLLSRLLEDTRAQRNATAEVLSEVRAVAEALDEAQQQSDHALALPRDSDDLDARQATSSKATAAAEQAAACIKQIKSDAHTRIPFLAGRSAPGMEWELAEQDALVRAAVNEATAEASGRLDALRATTERLAEQINRPETPPPQPSLEPSPPPTTPVTATDFLPRAADSPSDAAVLAETADHVQPLGLSIRRSHAPSRFAFTDSTTVDDVFGSSPAPTLARSSKGDAQAASLRAVAERLEGVEVHDWLDDEVLELPVLEEAMAIEDELDGVAAELDRLDDGLAGAEMGDDLEEVRGELRRKRGAAEQVTELATFRGKAEDADGALSDLLNAIDASSPDLLHPGHASEPGSRTALQTTSLPDALAASKSAVQAVKTASVLLQGDSRVQSELDRLEQALEEMVAMAEEVEQDDRSGRGSPLSARSRVSSRTSSLSHGIRRPDMASGRSSVRSTSSSSQHSLHSLHSISSSVRSTSSRIVAEGRLPRPRLSGSQSSASLASSSASLSRSGSVNNLPRLSRSTSSSHVSRLPKSSSFAGGAEMGRTVSNASAASNASTSSTHSRGSRRSLSQSTSALLATPLARRFAGTPSGSSGISGVDTTPRRRSKASSGIPVATPRAPSRSTATPTVAQPFSFATTGTRRALTQRSPNTPRLRKTSGNLSTPTAEDKRRLKEKLETTPSRYMDSVRRSSATASERRRRSGSWSSPKVARKHYKANPARKVDVELGKVVNALPIAVEVKAAENEWHDQHGSYWIGGRLYFCRILRSKTCMVRVGGGWIRLETFLVSKFGKAEGVTISPSLDRTKPPPPPPNASVNGSERSASLRRSSSAAPQDSLWISSQALRRDLSASHSSALSPRRDSYEPGAASNFLAASVGAGGLNGSVRGRRISSSASAGGLSLSLLGSSVSKLGAEGMRRSSSSVSGGWGNDGGLSAGAGKSGSMRRGGSVGWGIGLGLPSAGSGLGVEERRASAGRRVSSVYSTGGSEVGSPRGQTPWRF